VLQHALAARWRRLHTMSRYLNERSKAIAGRRQLPVRVDRRDPSFAGPPYTTDDPEPVEYRHWEFYIASEHFRDHVGWSGTAPHFELNYGVAPDVQLHLIAPLAYARHPGVQRTTVTGTLNWE